MKHFITGITGFAGSHLAEKLVQKGEQVFGFDLANSPTTRIEHLLNSIKVYRGNLTVFEEIKDVVKEIKPDRIYHLAAISNVKKSFNSKRLTMEVNLFGSMNLLESVLASDLNPRILFIGSASQYGQMNEQDPPIDEHKPLQPMSPYGLSKTCQEYLGKQYVMTENLDIVMVRCFNYTGIRQDPDFVCSDFAKQIAEIEFGLREPVITVGNIKVKRDFTDVSDMMDAYMLALDMCHTGEVYNLCSGTVFSIEDILDILISQTRCSISIKTMQNKLRPADISFLKGDHAKFSKLTHWEPRIPFKDTLTNLLGYWRKVIQI
ncbi:MAG: hypothetical protein A2161_00095 [Candidatus Schekmanbacteria bacterium RBG_13_48_7]|uniref:NAD(P)-binding domain-containing protein n=1 Tax=Candidatus Schekmanbacteria bacterium RBG_13_48_7 TaxID=1817878 RepID=A0A1F7S2E8_9BACT|nr:MAG: hypothetical protein A2161_00095 [Candidatus Schekmanbacteria bacterium RBG_13_48_7]